MCYKDWIELFSSFDVCLLPSKFSESRSGPCFDAESVANGVFEEDQPVIKVKMSVGAKRNVFLQCLLDCNIEFAKTNQFISLFIYRLFINLIVTIFLNQKVHLKLCPVMSLVSP